MRNKIVVTASFLLQPDIQATVHSIQRYLIAESTPGTEENATVILMTEIFTFITVFHFIVMS